MTPILNHILNIIKESFLLFAVMAPYLLLGFGVAGLLHSFIPSEKVYKHLGGRGILPLIKAVIFGAPLPLCSCGVIPVAASLRRDGASKPATLSFLVATPTTGVDSILATFALMGPLFAIFRPIAAVVAGIAVGLVAMLMFREGDTHKHEEKHFDYSQKERSPFVKSLRTAAEYGFGELVADIGKTLIWAVLLGGLISYILPAPLVERYLGNTALSFIIMLAIAVPMYVCATGSIPIAAALIAKGMNPGAALIFLIAGPATNTVTIAVVAKQLGKKAAVLYVATIVVFAVIFGIAFNMIWQAMGGSITLITHHHEESAGWLEISSAIILILLILRGIFIGHKEKHSHEEKDMKLKISVPDMTCKHCQATIERAVCAIPGVSKCNVNLDNKSVMVDGEAKSDDIVKAIKDAGYTVESVSEGE